MRQRGSGTIGLLLLTTAGLLAGLALVRNIRIGRPRRQRDDRYHLPTGELVDPFAIDPPWLIRTTTDPPIFYGALRNWVTAGTPALLGSPRLKTKVSDIDLALERPADANLESLGMGLADPATVLLLKSGLGPLAAKFQPGQAPARIRTGHVPEPAPITLLAVGFVAMALRKR